MIKMWFNSGMNIHAHRRQRLLNYIASNFGSNRSEFSRLIGLEKQRLQQVLSDTWRDGNNFGEKMARKIEASSGMAVGALDRALEAPYDGLVAGEPVSTVAAVQVAPVRPTLSSRHLDPTEQQLLQAYRQGAPETQAALRKLMRVLPLADEAAIGDQIHMLCRAINERLPLTLVSSNPPERFTPTEQALLTQFRARKPSIQRLVLLAADCATPLPDDEAWDNANACTRQEWRLLQCYRDGSAALRQAIILAASYDDSSDNSKIVSSKHVA